MKKRDVTHDWVTEARRLPEGDYKPRRPMHVELGEAAGVASFFELHWRASVDPETGARVPGLESVGGRLPAAAGAELRSILAAASDAQQAFLLLASQGSASVDLAIARAKVLVRAMATTLAWACRDEGSADEARLEAMRRRHAKATSDADKLAVRLDDHVALASALRDKIDGLGGFDVSMLDEATKLADSLREMPAWGRGPRVTAEARQARELRDRLVHLMNRRVKVIREAARFVFRERPELLRQVTSGYERKRRTERARKARKGDAKGVPVG